MMTLDQPTLFEVETPPVRTPKRKLEGTGKPKWSPYAPKKTVPCQDCMLLLLEAKGEAPASRPARWCRVQGGTDLLLCYAHGRARRAEDGIEEGGE